MNDPLFPGEPSPLPAPVPRRFAVLVPESEVPAPVRHVEGYEAFVVRVVAAGSDPAILRDDLRGLVAFVRTQDGLVEDEELLRSAGRFFGNSIAAAYPEAVWAVFDEPEIGVDWQGGFSVVSGLRHLAEHPEHIDRYFADLDRCMTSVPSIMEQDRTK